LSIGGSILGPLTSVSGPLERFGGPFASPLLDVAHLILPLDRTRLVTNPRAEISLDTLILESAGPVLGVEGPIASAILGSLSSQTLPIETTVDVIPHPTIPAGIANDDLGAERCRDGEKCQER